MANKPETQLMVDLPVLCLALQASATILLHYIDYFCPYNIKIGRSKLKAAKHYGIIFMCLNNRAVHLELAVDLTASAL